MENFKNLKVKISESIAHIVLDRPQKANALDEVSWKEIREVFKWADENDEVRVILLSGEGKHFCAGIDLSLLAQLSEKVDHQDRGRKSEKLRRIILKYQGSFNGIEKCRKPVIAAIHGACIGAGLDMVSACDMRFCAQDAYFSIKEIDMGMTADVGTLQRLPHLIGDGVLRELAYTGRKLLAEEAKKIGLVNTVFSDQASLLSGVDELAKSIASKSPLAIRGTKEMLLYARDHTVGDSLNYIATWNSGMLFSQDLEEAMMAGLEKRSPKFED